MSAISEHLARLDVGADRRDRAAHALQPEQAGEDADRPILVL